MSTPGPMHLGGRSMWSTAHLGMDGGVIGRRYRVRARGNGMWSTPGGRHLEGHAVFPGQGASLGGELGGAGRGMQQISLGGDRDQISFGKGTQNPVAFLLFGFHSTTPSSVTAWMKSG